MMKEEFDNLVGIITDPKCYERIEEVYMNCEFFQTKQQIAEFYKKYDMNGIERMYKYVVIPMKDAKEEIGQLTLRIANMESNLEEMKAKMKKQEQNVFTSKLEELLKLAEDSIDTVTRVGENIEVKYTNGYIKSICVECDSNIAIISDVLRRI